MSSALTRVVALAISSSDWPTRAAISTPRLARAVMSATGATDYNILKNNGAAAHQAVMHVHFHIIPKIGSAGLGVGWNSGTLESGRAKDMVAKMKAAL